MKGSSRLICISGPDGVGKTTQIKMIIQDFNKRGFSTKYVWLRFNNLLALPVLMIIKISGRNREKELEDGKRIGFYDLKDTKLLKIGYEFSLLLDLWLAAIFKISIPRILGKTVVCDRFALDTMIDISISIGNQEFYATSIGKMFLRLIPSDCTMIVMIADDESLRARRSEIAHDDFLEDRVRLYKTIGMKSGYTMVNVTGKSIEEVHSTVSTVIGV